MCEQELRLAEEEKRLPACRLADILAAQETIGRDGVLPLLGVEENSNKATLALKGAVILQGDTPALILSPQETEVLCWATSGRGNCLLELGPEGQNSSILLEDFDSRLTADLTNGQPHLTLMLDVKGRISQWQNAVDSPDPQKTNEAQQGVARKMTAQLNRLLQKLCAAGCDPLRCGERLQRRRPNVWNSIDRNSWPTLLQNTTWDISVTCSLTTFSGR
jgi:spore germination protein KC